MNSNKNLMEEFLACSAAALNDYAIRAKKKEDKKQSKSKLEELHHQADKLQCLREKYLADSQFRFSERDLEKVEVAKMTRSALESLTGIRLVTDPETKTNYMITDRKAVPVANATANEIRSLIFDE